MAKPKTKKEMWVYTTTSSSSRKKARRARNKARRKAMKDQDYLKS